MNSHATTRIERGEDSHLISLDSEGSVAVWRSFALRSAGFPAAWAAGLDSRAAVEAARRLADAEQHHHELAKLVRRELNALERSSRGEEKRALRKLRKRLARPELACEVPSAETRLPSLGPLALASADLLQARRAYEKVYEAEHQRLIAELQRTLQRGRLREAIAWESLDALRGIDKFLEASSGVFDKKTRMRFYTAISFLQRLCLKNDTIGFYGPIAWGQWSEEVQHIRLDPGTTVISRHQHFFEPWALNNLTKSFVDDPALRRHLPVRRLPSMDIGNGTITLPLCPPERRSPAELAMLSMSDGSVTTQQICERLAAEGVATALEAEELLDRFEREGLISRSGKLPNTYGCEEELARWLERMPEEPARSQRARLARLMMARRAVADACGNADHLKSALESLQSVFETETGTGRRGGGGFYEARSPVFQEAERDVRLRLGRRILSEIAAPLAGLQRVVLWYTQSLGERFEARVREIIQKHPAARMPFLSLQFELLSELPSLAESVSGELRERWQQTLADTSGADLADPGEALRRIESAFPAVPITWDLARRSSPDLLIAASSVESIRNGDYVVVLGEIHVATNTLLQACFSWLQDESELARWTASESKRPCLVLDLFESVNTVRVARPLGVAGMGLVIPHHENNRWSNESVVPLATLHVETRASGEVRGFSTASGQEWRVADMFNGALNGAALRAFRLTDAGARAPRVQLGRLVIQREQWGQERTRLDFASAKTAEGRFLACRRWAESLGLPRHVFIGLPTEGKPVYIDLHSPLYVELFSKLLRSVESEGAIVKITEMLPTPEQLWLSDADGNRYTTELRTTLLSR